MSQEELISVLNGAEPADLGIKRQKEQWFSAEDGLRTVRALIDSLQKTQSPGGEQLVSELQEFERVLCAAHERDIGWHMAIDY